MNRLEDAPDTLGKIFPECETLAAKALAFLELYDRCSSFRETARGLGTNPETGVAFHHQTVSRLYKFLKDTEVFAQYTWEKNEQVKDFLSKDFLGTIHDDYKEQRERIEAEIKDALLHNEKERALAWIREKRMLLKDMVATAISLSPSKPHISRDSPPKGDTTEAEGDAYTQEYKDAVEEYARRKELNA